MERYDDAEQWEAALGMQDDLFTLPAPFLPQFTPRERAWLLGTSHGTLGLDPEPPAEVEMRAVYFKAYVAAGVVRELAAQDIERSA